ncbi:hypothetical protein [Planococcus beigongshangi]|uniref:hypothetical protein n=1 Tax=Planococcus beigongshangi TaxID=2782536 RepID=UPI00193AFCA0|nr:hypothetical protein [Planococcus beigongshangi]
MKNSKVKWWVLTIGILTIISITVFRISQIEENHQKNLTLMEECMQKNGIVEVVTQNGFFSSASTVSCEE